MWYIKTDALGEEKWSWWWSSCWNKWRGRGLKLCLTLQITLLKNGSMYHSITVTIEAALKFVLIWSSHRWSSLVWCCSFTSFLCLIPFSRLLVDVYFSVSSKLDSSLSICCCPFVSIFRFRRLICVQCMFNLRCTSVKDLIVFVLWSSVVFTSHHLVSHTLCNEVNKRLCM